MPRYLPPVRGCVWLGKTRAHMADPHIVTKLKEGREEDVTGRNI